MSEMMMIYYYREIWETYSGSFPLVRIQSSCRCPASKPRVHPLMTTICINNSAVTDGGATWRMKMNNSRLDVNSHPLEYVNDGDINSFWLSTSLQQVTLTIDLGDTFQVITHCISQDSSQREAVPVAKSTLPRPLLILTVY